MQIELTLTAPEGSDYAASDLGFLLHKHPAHLHERDVSAGKAIIFYSAATEERATAVLYLDVDPVALVRGKGGRADGLLDQYVNDRAYAASSFLSVALGRSFGQSMAGKSKERQALADRPLSFEARVVPVSSSGGEDFVRQLFEPLGYSVAVSMLNAAPGRELISLTIGGTVRLKDLLNHLYVLVPVLDNAKHYWIDQQEIDNLLAKGEGWLADHPARELIARRSLKHRRGLVDQALSRLAESDPEAEEEAEQAKSEGELSLEKPIRLHELRLEAVSEALAKRGVTSVVDIGCGEGRLLQRLLRQRGLTRILGADPSVASLERAARRLKLDEAGDALRERISLQLGSATYGDRRWRGFDAATLVEVIEHIDPPRLPALAMSVFGEAAPGLVLVTTPNREYNTLFEGMAKGALRHSDHRFEWTRQEFEDWCRPVAEEYGYGVTLLPLGPIDETHGAPSQMAVFERRSAEEEGA